MDQSITRPNPDEELFLDNAVGRVYSFRFSNKTNNLTIEYLPENLELAGRLAKRENMLLEYERTFVKHMSQYGIYTIHRNVVPTIISRSVNTNNNPVNFEFSVINSIRENMNNWFKDYNMTPLYFGCCIYRLEYESFKFSCGDDNIYSIDGLDPTEFLEAMSFIVLIFIINEPAVIVEYDDSLGWSDLLVSFLFKLLVIVINFEPTIYCYNKNNDKMTLETVIKNCLVKAMSFRVKGKANSDTIEHNKPANSKEKCTIDLYKESMDWIEPIMMSSVKKAQYSLKFVGSAFISSRYLCDVHFSFC